MNTKKVFGVIVLVVVVLVGGFLFKTKGNKTVTDQTAQDKKTTAAQESTQVAAPESRCDALLTLEEAKTTSGLAYSKRDVSGQTLGKIVVTTCTYSAPGLSASIKPLSVLTRLATTTEEAKKIFEESKTASYSDGETLTGIGEQALWSPSFGQVSVLKGQTWLIVTAIKNQELAKKVAQELVDKVQ